jgi:hypothetical protein
MASLFEQKAPSDTKQPHGDTQAAKAYKLSSFALASHGEASVCHREMLKRNFDDVDADLMSRGFTRRALLPRLVSYSVVEWREQDTDVAEGGLRWLHERWPEELGTITIRGVGREQTEVEVRTLLYSEELNAIVASLATRREDLRSAYPYPQRLEIVKTYRKDKKAGHIASTEAWAQSHYGISGKTLRRYLEEFEEEAPQEEQRLPFDGNLASPSHRKDL